MINSKFFKDRRRLSKIISTSGDLVIYGDYGIKSTCWGRLTPNQIESSRKVISKNIKKFGKIWLRVYPDRSFTKKPIDVRMGNGKGELAFYFFYIKPGKIIYEISGVSKSLSLKVLKLASFKLPFKTIIVEK